MVWGYSYKTNSNIKSKTRRTYGSDLLKTPLLGKAKEKAKNTCEKLATHPSLGIRQLLDYDPRFIIVIKDLKPAIHERRHTSTPRTIVSAHQTHIS